MKWTVIVTNIFCWCIRVVSVTMSTVLEHDVFHTTVANIKIVSREITCVPEKYSFVNEMEFFAVTLFLFSYFL